LSRQSPFGGQTVAPTFSLPKPVDARPRVPIISPERSGRFFDSAYERAYQSYEAWIELGDDKSDTDEYRRLLGETLGKVKLAHEATLLQGDTSKQIELAYLLAFLSHKAGHLIEAIIYGQTVARLGDAENDATRDAAFITLAACQEASSTHWASPSEVGELHQMQMIAELMDTKWPDEPQRDAIWSSLATSYAAFGHYDQAISAYAKINKESSLFSDAALGSGVAYWTIFLNAASKPNANADDMLELLANASSKFQRCVETLEQKLDKPTMPLFSAKQMLAVIADRTGDRKAVLRWTTEGKFPMLNLIRVAKKPQPSKILVPSAFAQNIFELAYQAKKELGDIEGATEILKKLEALLGNGGIDGLDSMQSATLIARFKELLGQGHIAMSDVQSLDKLIATTSMKTSSSDEAMEWLWIAQSWASLGEQSNHSDVTRVCYERAAAICQDLLGSTLVPQDHITSTRLRQMQWLRLSGNPEASLEVLGEILRATPNVLDLQMQAALTMEELAIEGDSESQLRQAISGTSDEPAFWGWAKLAVNLHRLRYSEKGTQQHAQSLLQSHFHLARCRWMLASVLAPGSERATLQKQTLKQLGTARLAIAGTDPDADQWREVFETLATKVTAVEQ
jgi:tetratricopeptide (TPR) repeat protein